MSIGGIEAGGTRWNCAVGGDGPEPTRVETFATTTPAETIGRAVEFFAAVPDLEALGVGYEARIVSAHRTPDRLVAFAKGAKAAGFKVVIAGAGGAAHLPGMTAAMTTLPVFGVPVPSKALSGQDSLLSIVQMPAGVPVGTLAIGEAGAVNSALLACAVLALSDEALSVRLEAWRAKRTAEVAEHPRDDAQKSETAGR